MKSTHSAIHQPLTTDKSFYELNPYIASNKAMTSILENVDSPLTVSSICKFIEDTKKQISFADSVIEELTKLNDPSEIQLITLACQVRYRAKLLNEIQSITKVLEEVVYSEVSYSAMDEYFTPNNNLTSLEIDEVDLGELSYSDNTNDEYNYVSTIDEYMSEPLTEKELSYNPVIWC